MSGAQRKQIKYTISDIQSAWPTCIDYDDTEAQRLLKLATKNQIYKENLPIWIRNNAKIVHVPPVDEIPVIAKEEANADPLFSYKVKTEFNRSAGGGQRVIRSGKEMT